MYGPEHDDDGEPKVDPQLRTFDTASGLWLVVVGSIAFLFLVHRGLRMPSAMKG